MLHTIGFDKVYERGEGAHFWDADGNDYLDMLAGFGVMGLGRHHPVVRKALHDVLDAQLADLTRFDCQPLPGLLAEKLLAHSPHLDRVFFGNSGTEAVETALKSLAQPLPDLRGDSHSLLQVGVDLAPGLLDRLEGGAQILGAGLEEGAEQLHDLGGVGRGGAAAAPHLVAAVLAFDSR
ncbi:Acetylornithine/succinyldiaminopimelate aminotransferase [Streptomyces alboniger]